MLAQLILDQAQELTLLALARCLALDDKHNHTHIDWRAFFFPALLSELITWPAIYTRTQASGHGSHGLHVLP
jgi:hypothetical protein